MLSNDIAVRLLEWDGKHTDVLKVVHAEFADHVRYIDVLAGLCGNANPVIQIAASWLVLYAGKTGLIFSEKVSETIVETLDVKGSWAHSLHICQAMRYLAFSERKAMALIPKLDTLVNHQRPLVRAWAVDAMVLLGKTHGGELTNKARKALTNAANDPAASVRARARNLAV